jgi:type IX secretion system PorP/SprF family membrane protein
MSVFLNLIRNHLILFLVLWVFPQRGSSQFQPIQNQYILNPFFINPSFAGAVNGTRLGATYRTQWVEFPNAPNTQTIVYQTNKGNLGVGGWLYRDQNGLTGNSGFESSFSYHLRFNGSRDNLKNARILFGLGISGNQWTVREDQFTPSTFDPLITGGNPSRFTPNVHAGFYFAHEPFYVGFSVRDLLPQGLDFATQSTYRIHLLSGFQIAVASDFYVEPSFLIRLNAPGDWQFDVNTTVNVPISGKIALQSTFSLNREQLHRNNENLSVSNIFVLKLDAYHISYRYIYPLSSIRSFTLGTHEWMVSYRFGKTKGIGVFCPTFSGY